MTAPHHQHPFAPRWASFVALAFVAIVAASLLDEMDRRVLSEPAPPLCNHAPGAMT